jgi:phosphoglycolate phosphatase
MLLELMDECFASPERTLMIGDTTHDVLMAKNAGVASLAVSYGAHSVSALVASQPTARVNSVAELSDWLRNHG